MSAAPTHGGRFDVDRRVAGGFIERCSIESTSAVVVEGWVDAPLGAVDALVEVHLAGVPLELMAAFRTLRPDVAVELDLEASAPFHGAVWQFRIPATTSGATELTVRACGETVLHRQVVVGDAFHVPYALLVDSPVPQDRQAIYSSGDPDPMVNPEAFAIASTLPTPMLDFGCGSGALVRALRASGLDVEGLEVERPGIVGSLGDDVRGHIRLTDGGFPLPLADRSYASLVATEVLEHIEDLDSVVAELKRVTDREIFVSVPDASAIPALFPHAVVPWHLLESTHLHFFSATALEGLFAPEFEVVERYRIGRVEVNGTLTFTSVAVKVRRVSPAD